MRVGSDTAGVIRRMWNQHFPLHQALLELIDNSIDAQASLVTITEKDGDLWITDNGEGLDNLADALIVGKSSKRTGIGRYGVGLKDACVRYSNSTVIASRGKSVRAPWKLIIEEISDGEVFPEDVTDDGMTHIVLEDFRERYGSAICTDSIRRVYAPLIESKAIQICLNGSALDPMPKPSFTEELDVTLQFRDRLARLSGGIFNAGDAQRRYWSGYNPFYQGRLIGDGKITKWGVGDEACSNFAFQVDLIDGDSPWVLATNKNAAEELEELIDKCYWEHTRPLLKMAAEQTRLIDLRSVEDSINRALNPTGNQTRRRKQGKEGTVKPKDTGERKKKTFTARADGGYTNGERERNIPAIQFRFEHLSGDTLGICQQHGRGLLLEANLDNKFINKHRGNNVAILAIAKLVYSVHRKIAEHDTVPDEVVERIMDCAGYEMNGVNEEEES
mgnify:CR=1 FL=1|tara:strand:+ start:811 stop:2148 length:1338 start_codon:yes stop_codon:yes gene_type:complete